MKYRTRTVPVAVALMAAIILTACNQQQAEQQEPATPTPIPTPIVPTKPTYTVKRGEVIRQIQFTGRVGPTQELELFFKVSGRVRSVMAEQSDIITKGMLLADLEIEPLERQVAQSTLDLERTQVSVQRAQKALDDQIAQREIDLKIRQLEYQRIASRNLDLQKVQVEVALKQAEISVQQAQAGYDRTPIEGRGASGAAMQLQAATLNYQVAKANYDLTIANLYSNQRFDLAVAAQQISQTQAALTSLQSGVDPLLVNDVKRAEMSLNTLKAQVGDAQVAAPFNGKVTSMRISPGSAVEAYKPVVVVADPSALEITAEPASALMQELKEGMECNVALVNIPDKQMLGKIRQLPYPFGSGGAKANDTTNADTDKSTHVTINPDALKDTKLQMGDLARVTIVLEKKADALWLPPQAVRTFEGRKFVVIQEGEGQRRVDVKVGIQSEDRVEILEGVKEGQVAVAP